MHIAVMITVVLLPILGGILIQMLPFQTRKQMLYYIEGSVLVCLWVWVNGDKVH